MFYASKHVCGRPNSKEVHFYNFKIYDNAIDGRKHFFLSPKLPMMQISGENEKNQNIFKNYSL